jgi:zinc protease
MPRTRRSLVIGLVAALGLAAAVLVLRREGGSDAPSRDVAPERMQATSFALPNGLAVELLSGPCGDRAGVALLFSVGANHDPAGRSGMTQVVAKILGSASPARRVQADRDHTLVSATVPASALDATLVETASLIAHRELTEADFAGERAAVLAELARRAADAEQMAQSYALESIRPSGGSGFRGGVAAEVEAIELDELQAFVEASFAAGNARLVVVGRFDVAHARERIEQGFGALSAGTVPVAREDAGSTATGTLVMGDAPAAVALAVPAPALADPQYPAFLVLASRLLAELSGSSAWKARYDPVASPEALVISGPTRPPESPDAAGARLRSDVAALAERPLAPGELASTRSRFARLLGVDELSPATCAAGPEALAIARARGAQLGLQALPLAEALQRATQAELERVAPLFTGARTSAVIAGGVMR